MGGIIIGRNAVYEHLTQAKGSGDLELHIAKSAHGRIIDAVIAEANRKNIPVFFEERSYFANLSASRHQGVVLLLHRDPMTAPSPHPDDLIATCAEHRGVIVLLDHLTDPRNAGAIIRTAEALGCSGAVIPKQRSAHHTPAFEKASAGATAHLPIVWIANVASFLEQAKKQGMWIIGTSERGNDTLDRVREYRPAVVVIGSEGEGMRRLTEDKCDLVVRVPLRGKIASLNASVAAGIVLYEILKEG